MAKKPTNPNGANQYILDPRQSKCWELYTNPKSEFFGNAYQSAMEVGYEENTAAVITTQEWFKEKLRRLNLLSKAEKVLEDTLVIDHIEDAIGAFGPIVDPKTKERVKKVNVGILKIKQDSAKFVAETHGKMEGYSKRTETDITSKGEKIKTVVGFNYLDPHADREDNTNDQAITETA
jgi:phage terminase small subunit